MEVKEESHCGGNLVPPEQLFNSLDTAPGTFPTCSSMNGRSSEPERLRGGPVLTDPLTGVCSPTHQLSHGCMGSSTCRVAVVGNVDAGKSTLLGVLTHGELDNGRGFARQKLFRHKHEIESGRTSSVGNDILGFDSEGNVVNKPDSHGGSLEWTKICEKSTKVITFIDLAGHEKYLKTTVFGMTGHLPDFCMLMVSMRRP